MKPGSVVLVQFPFTSLEKTKKRPALVLSSIRHSSKIELVTFAMITSKLDGLDLEGDIKLKDWVKARLLHPSLVRMSKVATVDAELIDRALGMISEADKKEISKVFGRLYRHWLAE